MQINFSFAILRCIHYECVKTDGVNVDDVQRTALFFKYIEEKDFDKLSKLLSSDFKYYGPVPDSFDQEVWLSFQKAVQHAFPDWAYNLKKIEKLSDSVEAIVQITGTHLNALALPLPNLKPIPPTGTQIRLPEEKATFKFKDGKVSEFRVHSTLHGGLPGLLGQLRVE
ncbi:MAG: nuclear transport factor 2 family protein [Waddliaceae bacterium]